MLRVPTALTSSSLPGLMWGSRASPGEGRTSVLLSACACLAASLICFLVLGAVGSPEVGFSGGTSEETSALAWAGAALASAGVVEAGVAGVLALVSTGVVGAGAACVLDGVAAGGVAEVVEGV